MPDFQATQARRQWALDAIRDLDSEGATAQDLVDLQGGGDDPNCLHRLQEDVRWLETEGFIASDRPVRSPGRRFWVTPKGRNRRNQVTKFGAVAGRRGVSKAPPTNPHPDHAPISTLISAPAPVRGIDRIIELAVEIKETEGHLAELRAELAALVQ